MKIIISPAKKMKDINHDDFVLSKPVLLEKTKILHDYLISLDYSELKKLLDCNDKIAMQNKERFEDMTLIGKNPALLSYDGIAYTYMGCNVFTTDMFDYCKQHLRILSGFYGILRPFDAIEAYRLEMQAKLKTEFCDNLYDFWKDDLYKELMSDADDHLILNLASKEYSKTIEKYLKKDDIFVDVLFLEDDGKAVKEKGVIVKMARGDMVRYLASHQVETIEDVKHYDGLGFVYQDHLSSPTQLVFIRKREK